MFRPSKDNSLFYIILVCVLGIAFTIFVRACIGSDITYHRRVSGKITSIGSRYVRGQDSGQEKVALQLSPFTADATVQTTAGGSDGLAIECVSTRCAALEKWQCVDLLCSQEVRFFEPNVIECKMVKTVECK